MSRKRRNRSASRCSAFNSRSTIFSLWRSVSTTSMASISSSSFWGSRAGASVSAIEWQGLSLRHESGDAALSVFDRVANFSGVLGRENAHLIDDVEGALLERDDGVHELFDCISADGWAVAGPHGCLAYLVADLREHL